jgi:mannan endo-1,6-alpha-mannosidase
MMDFYAQNQTEGIPGKLTDTWYIAGAMFMTLIQYWHSSGDGQYNDIVSHDLMFQAGDNFDYFDANYSRWLVRFLSNPIHWQRAGVGCYARRVFGRGSC